MTHHDSTVATARMRLVLRPHLAAAHWMISSVVPRKLPSTYFLYGISLCFRHARSIFFVGR